MACRQCQVILLVCALTKGFYISKTKLRSSGNLVIDRTEAATLASGSKPRTAILLSGLMRNWDMWDGEWAKSFMERMVEPNNADIFIHTSEFEGETHKPMTVFGGNIEALSLEPKEAITVEMVFGDYLKEWKSADQPSPPQGLADLQFWHVERAWNMMEVYEKKNNFKYDVVIKTRTEIAPNRNTNAILDLAGWQDEGKIHMATDMLWWGRRDDMEKTVGFYSSILSYYVKRYPDPSGRPIHVKALLETYLRDPRYSNNDDKADWHTLSKIDTLPYPDMGKDGPVENLRAAVDAGIDVCIAQNGCKTHRGDHGSGGDYTYGEIRCEKDILDNVLRHDLIICDVGKGMHSIFYKGFIEERPHARDC